MNLIYTLRILGGFSRNLHRRLSRHYVQFAFLSDLNKKEKSYKQDKRKTIIMPGGRKSIVPRNDNEIPVMYDWIFSFK